MKKYNPQKIEKDVALHITSQSQNTASQSQNFAERTQKDAETQKNAEKVLRNSAFVPRGSAILDKRPKYYVLDMFPYPSGDGLHMGHTESYTASDIIYRYKKLQGYNVLHRQGFDAFGLPAENYAIKTGIHPKKTTEKNIKNYLRQMKMLELGYDYDHIVKTSDPSYYKWTQWLFGKFFENGLVERKTDKINWCPSCQTVIANEQVIDGRCERCKTKIQQKEVKGWFFKITKFAEDLIKDLDKVDWPEATKKNQRNWIGKSIGSKISFEIRKFSRQSATSTSLEVEVFTTRPDTLFGATYLVLAPEHSLIQKLKSAIKNWEEVEKYVEQAKNKTEMERLENKEKTGVKLEGLVAINPANGESIPIFVADYVLADYGTGAIMAVPAHDERDYEFATNYNRNCNLSQNFAEQTQIPLSRSQNFAELTQNNAEAQKNAEQEATRGHSLRRSEATGKGMISGSAENELIKIRQVIAPKNKEEKVKLPYTGSGILINSGKFDGMDSEEAKKAITEFVGGEMTVNYRLRDWSISRQRYWGCPIPIVYSPEGEAKFVGEENLPWLLPEDVDFVPTGTAPLSKSKELKKRTEKIFGKGWTPEVDTMDTFVDSSWYFLRYPDPENEKEFCSPEKLKKWLPVDLYIGGAEHTYMHLLYARFFVKAMHRMGLVDFDEPFLKLRHQGMVLDKNGVKMSKSKGNVINPDDMVKKFGADATRMYVMFAAPLDEDVIWNEEGVKGVYRFLEKISSFFDTASRSQKDAEQTPAFAGQAQKDAETQKDAEMLNGRGDLAPTPETKATEKGMTSGSAEDISQLLSLLHKTIKGVTEDIEELKFNTAISKLMIFINTAYGSRRLTRNERRTSQNTDTASQSQINAEQSHTASQSQTNAEWTQKNAETQKDATATRSQNFAEQTPAFAGQAQKDAENAEMESAEKGMTSGSAEEIMEKFLILLSPFAPFLAEKLWQQLGHQDSIFDQQWPKYDPDLIKDELITMVIQVNGKVRDNVKVPADITEKEARKLALSREKIKKWTAGQEIKKVIFVKGRLINLVVK